MKTIREILDTVIENLGDDIRVTRDFEIIASDKGEISLKIKAVDTLTQTKKKNKKSKVINTDYNDYI